MKKQFQPTAEQIAEGRKIADVNEKSVLFLNDKGEFFTVENYALLSVGGSKERLAKLDYATVAATGTAEEDTAGANASEEETTEETTEATEPAKPETAAQRKKREAKEKADAEAAANQE